MPNLRDYGYKIVQIEVTNRCNMRCTFCPLPERDLPLRDMKQKEVSDILEEIAQFEGVEYVAFHQFGETLLYDELWACIAQSRQLGLACQLTTNGLLLKDEVIEKILQTPPNILRISLQTLIPKVYAETRGIKVPFNTYMDRLAKTLATLIDRQHGIDSIITDVAVNDLRYRGKKYWLMRKLGVVNPGDATISDPTPEKLRNYLIDFLKRIQSHSTRFQFSEEQVDKNIESYEMDESKGRNETAYQLQENNDILYKEFANGCRMITNHPVQRALCGTKLLGILADGTVSCCCADFDGSVGIGNIFEEKLVDILERAKPILDGLRNTGELHFETCKKCRGAPTKLGAWLLQKKNDALIARRNAAK
ncbi:MAG: radical SAM protein [Magnetococcales bacterium]|nr:radical SAM protein [Magnetococcales bacterium]